MAKLVVMNGEMKDKTFDLSEDKMTIGRVPDNQIHLENEAVSSHHAELIRKGDDFVIRDLNSTNGTRVNDQRVVETRLYHGDIISFGLLQLQYHSSAHAPQPLPSPSRKTVDLTRDSSTTRAPTFISSAQHGKKQNKTKIILQIAAIVFGLIATCLIAWIILKIVTA